MALFAQWCAHADQDKFQVRFKGPRSGFELIKRQIELKMIRSFAYCRGFYFPKRVDKWNCSVVKRGIVNCKTGYQCTHVRRDLNRATEKRRLASLFKKELAKGQSVSTKQYSFYIDKKKYKDKRKQMARRKVKKKKIVVKKKKILPIQGPMVFQDEGIELFNDDVIEEEVATPEPVKEELALEQEIDEMEGLGESDLDSKNDSWRFAEKDEEALVKEMRKSKSFQWRRFSTQLVIASDNSDNSFFSPGFSYKPSWKYNDQLFLEGEFGFHQFKLDENAFFVEESFLVFTYAVKANYFVMKNVFASLGLGLQSWGSQRNGGPSFFRLNYGLGYRFMKKKWGFIDRLFVTYTIMSSDNTSVSETQVGLGFSF